MNIMNIKIKRIIMSVLGVVFCGISVGFFKFAAFGVDPFQSLMSGIDHLVPLSYGTLNVVVNAVLLLFALIFDRHYIGIGTMVNLFLLGYIVEFSQGALNAVLPEESTVWRVIIFIIGFVSHCFSSAIYMTADLGVSTYDAVAIIMAEKWKIGKFKYIRIITDFVCVVLGITLFMIGGGTLSGIPAFVGIGTILTAFFMGPLIDFFNRTVAQPILYKKTKK